MTFWIVLALAVVGHFGLHLVIYNRLNATGLRRRTIKLVEKVFILTCVVVPAIAAYQLATVWTTNHSLHWSDLPIWTIGYGLVCLFTLSTFGPMWLWNRPMLHRTRAEATRTAKLLDGRAETKTQLALTRKCSWQSRLPLNQLFKLSIDQVELVVPGLPQSLDGLKIAHLSDLHLTGHIAADYGRWVVDKATEWHPDLIAVTGDIVDKEPCIAWLPKIFGDATAPFGCYFVLGNHDTRVPDPNMIRQQMTQCGWTDLGGTSKRMEMRGTSVEMIGNEEPWFAGPPLSEQAENAEFRVLLSHSPDQIEWARKHHVGLMLAGHTHGGQGQLPLAGPIFSPSWYGSRFASGDFYLAPTTMHVSRGLGGVHLLRIQCPPELSLITLRAK